MECEIMKYDFQLLIKAINYATEKHYGQTRLDGRPYITHPLAVCELVDGIVERIVAVLHDVLEDTDASIGELYDTFGDEITNAVIVLTKQEGTTYEDYIQWIKDSDEQNAIAVKIADLHHNLSTIDNIPDMDKRKRLKSRYIKALEVLEE